MNEINDLYDAGAAVDTSLPLLEQALATFQGTVDSIYEAHRKQREAKEAAVNAQ